MRPISGRILFFLGPLVMGCSVFPEQAPAVRPSTGGAGAGARDAGNGGTPEASGTGGGASGGTKGSGGANGGDGAVGSGGTTGSGGTRDAGDATIGDADADSALDGSVQSVTYVASVADCVEAVVQPQALACLAYSTSIDGPNELWVDIRRGGHRAFTMYLAFPVDSVILGRTVVSVELRMTVTSYTNAAGTAPDVWEVVPFTAPSLYVQTPAQVDTTPLATSPGAVAKDQTVVYSLPTSVAKANEPIFLSLVTPTGGDGTGYWGTNGDRSTQPPPVIVVNYR